MISLEVAESGRSATLNSAVLCYGNQEGTLYATVHPVLEVNGRPSIMPGRLITDDDMGALVKGVSGAAAAVQTQWLDTSVLGKGPDRMIWWTPPGKRPMFFEKSKDVAKTFAGGASCPVPGLIWMLLARDLYVYAVKGAARPERETPLWQAPLFNIWGRGRVCHGNTKLPSDEDATNRRAWEQTVFGSRFTHPNFTEKDRLIKGAEPVSFWKRMVAKPPNVFPENKLVGLPLTVGDLLELNIRDRLAALPKPKGEF